MRRVLLDLGLDGRREAWLRPMTGADEDVATTGVVGLIDHCLVGRPRAIEPGSAARMALSDRDRILAAIHAEELGDRIDADADCHECGTRYSLGFSLGRLVEAERPRRPEGLDGPDGAGHFTLAGVTFRLPTSEDLAAGAAAEADLLAACVVAGDPAGREAEIEAAMAAIGPLVDLELDAVCPHCGAAVRPRFAMAEFLAAAMEVERGFLLREVHIIARAYGWSHRSIMALPRRDRREFVRLIRLGASRSVPLERLGRQARAAV